FLCVCVFVCVSIVSVSCGHVLMHVCVCVCLCVCLIIISVSCGHALMHACVCVCVCVRCSLHVNGAALSVSLSSVTLVTAYVGHHSQASGRGPKPRHTTPPPALPFPSPSPSLLYCLLPSFVF